MYFKEIKRFSNKGFIIIGKLFIMLIILLLLFVIEFRFLKIDLRVIIGLIFSEKIMLFKM